MFNGGTLLCLIFIAGTVISLYWPEIKDALILDGDNHPDALSSMDLRQRGLDPINGVLEHETRMNARAERLGYTR